MQRLCQVLGVSRSGYYRRQAGAGTRAARQEDEDALVEETREIHAEHKETYGALRVHAELRGFGYTVNRKRVARLMRKHRIVGRHLRRRKTTTIPDPIAPRSPIRSSATSPPPTSTNAGAATSRTSRSARRGPTSPASSTSTLPACPSTPPGTRCCNDRLNPPTWTPVEDADDRIEGPELVLGDLGGVCLFECRTCPGRPFTERFDA
ncbi:IS3 family transposase [Kitasatospora sp. NPDC004240]